MEDQDVDKELAIRIARDGENAVRASKLAKEKLSQSDKTWSYDPENDGDIEMSARIHNNRRKLNKSLKAIADSSFHAMVEVQTTTETSSDDETIHLWYANNNTNTYEDMEGIKVLSWTHPGFQVAISSDIGERIDFKSEGLVLRSVTPFARAKFDQVRPEISGVYEPGGRVYKSKPISAQNSEHANKIIQQSKIEPTTGLKTVKQGMSREQVQAFIARMSGVMVIIGAPGSGKTTVAFQRIQFLLDQQELRIERNAIPFKPELTKVFLANQNLEFHANVLLEKELQIPFSFDIINGVDSFVADYLENSWKVRNRATRIRDGSTNSQNYARKAIVGIAEASDLTGLWLAYENQIKDRLSKVNETLWSRRFGGAVEPLVSSLKKVAEDTKESNDPNNSRFSMERLHLKVNRQYDRARQKIRLKSRSELEPFETKFKQSYERARGQVRLTVQKDLEAFDKKFKRSYERALHQIKSTTKKEVRAFDKQFVNLYERATEQILIDSQRTLDAIEKNFNKTYLLARQQIQDTPRKEEIVVFDKPFAELYKKVKVYLIEELESYGGEHHERDFRARRKLLPTSPTKSHSFSDSFIELFETTRDEILSSSLLELSAVDDKFKQTYQNARKQVTEPSSEAFASFDKPFTDLYAYVRMQIRRELETFDIEFRKWLYYVYDPISAMYVYFNSRKDEIYDRLNRSLGDTANVKQAIEMAIQEWKSHKFRLEDSSWIAWLLRFSLPRSIESDKKFRNIPSAISPAFSEGEQWSHVVIDEAQDLSVAEASLLGSLVHPKGALTISLDFKQMVSPFKGMRDTEAFKVGRSIRDQYEDKRYPFGKNFRQSKEIGLFLQEYYRIAFKEEPNFEVNPDLRDAKPSLIIAERQDYARLIAKLLRELKSSDTDKSVALIQIEEDTKQMNELRASLEKNEVPLAKVNQDYSKVGLVTSTVEKIKGLEFDACILLGLEHLTRHSAAISFNRAYVGLSRPARRLLMICEKFPPLLSDIDQSFYDTN